MASRLTDRSGDPGSPVMRSWQFQRRQQGKVLGSAWRASESGKTRKEEPQEGIPQIADQGHFYHAGKKEPTYSATTKSTLSSGNTGNHLVEGPG